ncbi:MAG: hypothetical protein ABI759_19230 [Candidatus Solibacter sp.]
MELRRFVGAVAARIDRVSSTWAVNMGMHGASILVSDLKGALRLSERAIAERAISLMRMASASSTRFIQTWAGCRLCEFTTLIVLSNRQGAFVMDPGVKGLDELNPKITTDCSCRSAQCLQGNGGISRGQESIQRRAARLHPARHLHFANLPGFHCPLYLEGNGLFDGNCTGLFKKALLLEEIVER